jgi:hypothetical protein
VSRRVSLRLVTGRAADEAPEGLAESAAVQALGDGIGDVPVTRRPKPAEDGQPPALGVTPAAATAAS